MRLIDKLRGGFYRNKDYEIMQVDTAKWEVRSKINTTDGDYLKLEGIFKTLKEALRKYELEVR